MNHLETQQSIPTPTRETLETTTGILYGLLGQDKYLTGTEVGEVWGAANRALDAIYPVTNAQWRRMSDEEIAGSSQEVAIAEQVLPYLFAQDATLGISPYVDRDNIEVALAQRKQALMDNESALQERQQLEDQQAIQRKQRKDAHMQRVKNVVAFSKHVTDALIYTAPGRFLLTAGITSGLGLGAVKADAMSNSLIAAEHSLHSTALTAQREIRIAENALSSYAIYETGTVYPNGIIATSNIERALKEIPANQSAWNAQIDQQLVPIFNEIPKTGQISIFEGKRVTPNTFTHMRQQLQSIEVEVGNSEAPYVKSYKAREHALQNHEFIEDWKAGLQIIGMLGAFAIGGITSAYSPSYSQWRKEKNDR